MTNSLLQLDNVSRYYGDFPAVKDISLTFNQGEVIGLLGLNGAGKSTTLKLLSGIIAPSFGKIRLHAKDLHNHLQTANASIGYLPEQPPLYLQQNVQEYLTTVAKLYGLSKANSTARIKIVMQQCGLEEVRQKVIGNLSKGYQQRVGIAQAILHQPDIIILDEPTVGLDPQQLLNIRNLLKSLAKEACIIFSSHMLNEVQAVADRIVIMHQGKVVHDKNNDGSNDLEKLFSDVIFGAKTLLRLF